MSKIEIVGETFPLVNLHLEKTEKVQIANGSMIFHSPTVELKTRMNGRGSGVGKFLSAWGRSLTSGESFFITEVFANDEGLVSIAPSSPGNVTILDVNGSKQYRLNDGAFLAATGEAGYKMEGQKISGALFGGTGGFFVMKTEGTGKIVINGYGSVHKITLNNESLTVDNNHVVAWSNNLQYNIHTENGILNSIGTGEGLVNTFTGTGEVYIQSLNFLDFSQSIGQYLDLKS